MAHVRIQPFPCFEPINVLRVASDQLARVSEGPDKAMRGRSFLDILTNLLAERCNESIED